MNESNNRKIVFVGPEQAGKTTMMCGWYHLLETVYHAEPELDYEDTQRLLDTYQRYQDDGVVNPTVRGEVTRSRFDCHHLQNNFSLELVDYAGEDISSSSSKFLHVDHDEHPLNELEHGFQQDLLSADWIVMVHDPKAIADGSPEQMTDSLWLANILPRLLFGGDFGNVSNATIYLSKADETETGLLDRAEENLKEALAKSNLATLPIKRGNAKVWRSSDLSEAERGFKDFFTHTMLKVLNQPRSVLAAGTGGSGRKSSWKWMMIGLVGISLLVAIFSVFNEPADTTSQQWESVVNELGELESKAEQASSFSEAQRRLKDLGQFESDKKTEFPDRFDELVEQIESVRKVLEAFKAPQGSDRIASSLTELRKLHQSNLLGFYTGLQKKADGNKEDAASWDKDARDEWTVLSDFCARVLDGVEIELAESSFSGRKWWSYYVGDDDLKLELWVAKPGDPKPFDDSTTDLPPLGTPTREPVKSGSAHSVLWTGATSEASRDKALKIQIGLEDQIWVRFFSEDFGNGTLLETKVQRRGPVGLDWFNRAQSLSIGSDRYSVFVRLNQVVEIPPAVQSLFQE